MATARGPVGTRTAAGASARPAAALAALSSVGPAVPSRGRRTATLAPASHPGGASWRRALPGARCAPSRPAVAARAASHSTPGGPGPSLSAQLSAELSASGPEADAHADALGPLPPSDLDEHGGFGGPEVSLRALLTALKAENQSLRGLVLEMATDSAEAQWRLRSLREAAARAAHLDVGAMPAPAAAPVTDPVRARAAALARAVHVAASGERLALSPTNGNAAPAPGDEAVVVYDASRGPLRGAARAPLLKVGWNGWDAVEVSTLERVPASFVAPAGTEDVDATLPPGEWWTARITIPELAMRGDAVAFDPSTGTHDNNGGRDFALGLRDALTPQGLRESIEATLEVQERARLTARDEEERAAASAAQIAIDADSGAARDAVEQRERERLAGEAKDIASARDAAAGALAAENLARPVGLVHGRVRWFEAPVEADPRPTPSDEVAEEPAEGAKAPEAPEAPSKEPAEELAPVALSWPEPGSTVSVAYDRAAGPLASARSVTAEVGADGWHASVAPRYVVLRPIDAAEVARRGLDPKGDWLVGSIFVPLAARVLDIRFGDEAHAAWDEGGTEAADAGAREGRDPRRGFHFAVRDAAKAGDDKAASVLSEFESAQNANATTGAGADPEASPAPGGAGASARAARAARRAASKAERRAAASQRRRDLRGRFLWTEPGAPRAGEPLRLLYDPDRGPLRGRREVYATVEYDRGARREPEPLLLEPVARGVSVGVRAVTITPPAHARSLEVRFADGPDEAAEGAFLDDNRALGYHLPLWLSESEVAAADVHGSSAVPAAPHPSPRLRVVHVAAEMAPIAKEGGLGDVVTALARAVRDEGHAIEVILPKYDCIKYAHVENLVQTGEIRSHGTTVKVWHGIVESLDVTFLEPCDGAFWVGRIYTDANSDRRRFGLFCEAAVELLAQRIAEGERVDVVHAHDWQSAPVTWLVRERALAERWPDAFSEVLSGAGIGKTNKHAPRLVLAPKGSHPGPGLAFTIHNLEFGVDLIGRAMEATDVATTVSPTYASEISGHPAIAAHLKKFYGIANGVDAELWDPARDAFLPRAYGADDAAQGKAAARAELRRRLSLASGDVPVIGVVTRLTHQKGIHLIKHAAWRTLDRGGQFALLGSAPDPRVQTEFNQLAAELGRVHPDRARLWFAYDEGLAHLIYAGADILLVPSMFEPCGLTQMIAMRYGTVPVVRKTGGLADTVFDVDHDRERAALRGIPVNGFSFEGRDAAGIDYALNRALTAWYDTPDWWAELVRSDMQIDFSWANSAQDYLELYYRAIR